MYNILLSGVAAVVYVRASRDRYLMLYIDNLSMGYLAL